MNKKVALIKTNEKNFFKYWLIFTKPMHKLDNQSINTLSLILYYYFDFKKKVDTDELAWKLTFDYDTKLLIQEELGLKTAQQLRNIYTSLRKNNAIKNNIVNKSLIPNLDIKNDKFSLIFNFEING